jgi:hypothetical protein
MLNEFGTPLTDEELLELKYLCMNNDIVTEKIRLIIQRLKGTPDEHRKFKQMIRESDQITKEFGEIYFTNREDYEC